MFTRTRQSISVYRQRASPLASLLDFAMWLIRHGLPPWSPKFWFVAMIAASFSAGALMTPYDSILLMVLCVFLGLVFLSLLLSYVRSISRFHTHALGLARQAIGESILDLRRSHSLMREEMSEAIHNGDIITSEIRREIGDELARIEESLSARTREIDTKISAGRDDFDRVRTGLESSLSLQWDAVRGLAYRQDELNGSLSTLQANVEVATASRKSRDARWESEAARVNESLARLNSQASSTNEARTLDYLCETVDELRRTVNDMQDQKTL